MDAILVLAGLMLLVAGGEALVRGASGVALAARLTPAVVGLTVVAAGTSMPEFVVSIRSALEGRAGLAVGNVVGSNLFNIGAILGIAALVCPLRVSGDTVRREWPVLLGASIALVVLSRDGFVGRVDAAWLVGGLIAFTAYAVRIGREVSPEVEAEGFGELVTASFGASGRTAVLRNGAAIAAGIGLLGVGSSMLVTGSVGIATAAGVSETVIGLTIVAAGTSTPELVTSVVASLRGRDDIAVANVIGSNLFNILGILGVTALVHPLAVPEVILSRDLLWMLGATVLLAPLMWSGYRVGRVEGAALVAGFAGYLGLLVHTA